MSKELVLGVWRNHEGLFNTIGTDRLISKTNPIKPIFLDLYAMSGNNADDVLDFLDELEGTNSSLDKSSKAGKIGGGDSTTGSGKVNENKSTKSSGGDEEILDFLDSIANDPAVTRTKSKSREQSRSGTPTLNPNIKKEVGFKETPTIINAPASVLGTEQDKAVIEQFDYENDDNSDDEPIDLPNPIASLSSWWGQNKGGLWDTASSAVKNAEARVREIQKQAPNINLDERLKTASKLISEVIDQDIMGEGEEEDNDEEGTSSQRANSTGEHENDRSQSLIKGINRFTSQLSSVLGAIAPPLEIGAQEKLIIHSFYDLIGYSSLIDDSLYRVFHTVMHQVEGGGDLKIVKSKSKEATPSLNIFYGTLDAATKLAKANLEEGIKNFVEDPEEIKESGKGTRISNIYVSILAVCLSEDGEQPVNNGKGTDDGITFFNIVESQTDSFFFIIYLSDPVHDINVVSHSQAFPIKWANWLDKKNKPRLAHSDDEEKKSESGPIENEEKELDHRESSGSESDDIDPTDWVLDWIAQGLRLSLGTVAQTYVIKRMGY